MNPFADLIAQRRARRRRDLAAVAAARAATRFVDYQRSRGVPHEGGPVAELAGAVDEWCDASAAAPPKYTFRAGRLIVTTTRQHGGPLVDDATVAGVTLDDKDPTRRDRFAAHGYAIRPPWAREGAHGVTALVVALIGPKRPPELYVLRRRWERWRHPLRGPLVVNWPHAGGMDGAQPSTGGWSPLNLDGVRS